MQIMPYQFPTTGQNVRVVPLDGEPWFVAADVCAVLDIGNPRQAVSYLDDDEVRQEPVTTNDGSGRTLTANVINEPGLYSLILRSRKPEARSFKRWITHEVLPAIRRAGTYQPSSMSRAELARNWYEAEVRLEAAEERLAVEGPKAEAWDVLASAHGDHSVREAAFILNRDPGIDTGQQRLFAALRDLGLIDRRDIPYASHAMHVRLRARSYKSAHGDEMPAKPQVRITAAGLAYLHRRLGGTAPLSSPHMPAEQLALA